jgi:hypothetical protein
MSLHDEKPGYGSADETRRSTARINLPYIFAIVVLLVVFGVREFHGANVLMKPMIDFFWEHREPIGLIITILGLAFAARQFMDARAHGKALQQVANSLGRSAEKTISAVESVTREAAKLEHSVQNINEAVHTLPPGTFVEQFCRRMTNIHLELLPVLRSGQFGDSPNETLEEVIRRLLSAVARHAHEYDLRSARYAANIMVFVPRNQSAPYFPRLSDEQIRAYIPEPISLDYFEGLLVLVEELTVVAQSGDEGLDVKRDDQVDQVIFGVPSLKNSLKGTKWTVLPGAPLSMVKWNQMQNAETRKTASLQDAVQGFDDMDNLENCNSAGMHDEKFDVSGHIIEALERYYKTSTCGKKVKSFLSFPLPRTGTDPAEAFAVLNVHCDQPTFLGPAGTCDARRRQQIFAGTMTPMVFIIAEAVEIWWKLSKANYCGQDPKTLRSAEPLA